MPVSMKQSVTVKGTNWGPFKRTTALKLVLCSSLLIVAAVLGTYTYNITIIDTISQ
jgi:hypothetical protein